MLGDIRFNEAMWNIRRKIFYSHLTRNSYHFRSSIVTPHVATLDATLIHATNIYRLTCVSRLRGILIVLAPATGCCLLFSRQFTIAAKKALRRDNDMKRKTSIGIN